MSSSKVRRSTSGYETKKTEIPAMPVVKVDAKNALISAKKQITFQVQAKLGSKVFLAGDFNNWDCEKNELLDKDGRGLYSGLIPLKPGTYEYKFHVNGTWLIDLENPNFKPNQMGTLNSVIIVA